MKLRVTTILTLTLLASLALGACTLPVIAPTPPPAPTIEQPAPAGTEAPVAPEMSEATAVPGIATPPSQETQPLPTEPSPAGLNLVPLAAEACSGMAQSLDEALSRAARRPADVEVTQSDVPMTDPSNGANGTGCRAMSSDTGTQYRSPDEIMTQITAVMTGGGWQEDPQMAAGGPTGIGTGFRNGAQVCQAVAGWEPGPAASCPADQPISECKLLAGQKVYTITLDCAETVGYGGAMMPNPASQNCERQGGSLTIEKRGDGGEIGVCYFQDNQQCEEWALMRGECPVGGVKVTGYVTPAGRYCAITGGTYTVTGNSGQADEQGTCTLPGGVQCDAAEYYNGTCDATTGKMPDTSGLSLTPATAEVCNGMAQALAEAVRRASIQQENIEVTQATEPVEMSDPSTQAAGTACRAMAAGTGEQFASPEAVMNEMSAVLTGGGWVEDKQQMGAGGPTGLGWGFRSGDLVAMGVAMWLPDAAANCPQDQPIPECNLTPAQKLYTITLDTAQTVKPAPLQGAQPAPAPAGNPASQNCTAMGGTPQNEVRGDGGQYGVCYFGDNNVCEQWALMRGECPVGGVKETGYSTPAARYCGITGGKYTITGTTNAGAEAGDCTLPGGQVCDAWDYYNGICSSSTPAPAAPTPAPTAVPPIGMPNPASQNCAAVGGTLRMEARGDGGQIGVCYFADNKQCEEWALSKGYCPVGGVTVTGYNTLAGRYCAITGGTYTVIGTTNTGAEAGTCALPDGKYCDAWSYYNGGC